MLANGKFLSFLLACLVSSYTYSSPVIDWGKNKGRVVEDYLNVHKTFFKQVCRGSYERYNELIKRYQGSGYFIPHFSQYAKLDNEAIENNLKLMGKKIDWIRQEKKKIVESVNFKSEKEKIVELRALFQQLLHFKEMFYTSNVLIEKVKSNSHEVFLELYRKTKNLLNQVSFLKPFGYPVDHLAMRVAYETYKDGKSLDDQRKKNDIFFRRKIYEDGAQNPDHTASDRFFRALVNTLDRRFREQGDILSEDFRYDYHTFLNSLERRLSLDPEDHRERLEEWLKRTQGTLDFYLNLLKKDQDQNTTLILESSSKARYELKHFDFKKKREVYNFWLHETELNRALYVMETILVNEAGDIDGRAALERRDIAQVVINRTRIPFYRTIDTHEELYDYLKGIGEDKLDQAKWLNTMFKVGEFSFTYFFISASKHVYCPDMSIRGKFLRRENVRIALGLLKKPNDNFKAIRYFSRASMLGRIDMAKVWSDFIAMPQRVGGKSLQNSILKKIYRKKDYKFIDRFYNQAGREYDVIEIIGKSSFHGKNFVYSMKANTFYDYRNPHFFRYFIKR